MLVELTDQITLVYPERPIHIFPSYKDLKAHTVYLSAYCSIIDKYRFRQQGNRERQQASMLLL